MGLKTLAHPVKHHREGERGPVIALDADGVLLDYSTAYAGAWARAFGEVPALREPRAYWPIDRWSVNRLTGERLAAFRACFDEVFWSSIPPVDGAVEACHALADAGYRLVCVTALDAPFALARGRNLKEHGFPIQEVVATGNDAGSVSPKAQAIATLEPVAFVDDFLPYHRGMPSGVHKALIMREPVGSPNVGEELALVDSQHADLQAFARWWLSTR